MLAVAFSIVVPNIMNVIRPVDGTLVVAASLQHIPDEKCPNIIYAPSFDFEKDSVEAKEFFDKCMMIDDSFSYNFLCI